MDREADRVLEPSPYTSVARNLDRLEEAAREQMAHDAGKVRLLSEDEAERQRQRAMDILRKVAPLPPEQEKLLWKTAPEDGPMETAQKAPEGELAGGRRVAGTRLQDRAIGGKERALRFVSLDVPDHGGLNLPERDAASLLLDMADILRGTSVLVCRKDSPRAEHLQMLFSAMLMITSPSPRDLTFSLEGNYQEQFEVLFFHILYLFHAEIGRHLLEYLRGNDLQVLSCIQMVGRVGSSQVAAKNLVAIGLVAGGRALRPDQLHITDLGRALLLSTHYFGAPFVHHALLGIPDRVSKHLAEKMGVGTVAEALGGAQLAGMRPRFSQEAAKAVAARGISAAQGIPSRR